MSKSRGVRIALYALLIFLAGVTTGAFLAPMVGRFFIRLPDSHEMSRQMLAHLSSELNLSDKQVTQIKPMVDSAGADMERIHHETMERILDRLAQVHAKIARYLTPEQQAKFKQMEADHRMQIQHFHHLRPPPPPP
ncbi:MAG TPA: hypothetical protein VGF73_07980 [Chthoniobacterales bacterium]|jgi:Spy/CpxP family protein refolding chaperone